MKTVFKKEMEVYDYTYGKGEIIEIQNYSYLDNILLVKFEDRDALIKYSLDGRLINYKSCGGELDSENIATNPTLSTSPYTLQGFEQKAPAPEFHEALSWLDNNENYQTVFEDERTYPSKEIYKAFEGLRKLIILRDYYNEGWQPDWSNRKQTKYTIEVYLDEMCCDNYTTVKKILSFRTDKIRDKFLEEQKELLEIAKPLL